VTRIAVVTGAASGIGAASARALARDGFRIWCADVNADGAEGVADGIRAGGAEAEAIALDVSDEAAVAAAFERITAREPVLDVLVNSAGIIAVCRFDEGTKQVWERVYGINVVGMYLCMQAALPALRATAQPPARIVNVASAAGKMPGPFTAPYNASKAAVINMSRSAAVALAPDILVNSVCPGVIDTPMWRQHLEPKLMEAGAGPQATFEARTAAVPSKRAGTAEEVAELVAFLAGPGGSYVLGEDLNVNGGLAMY
jgi:NAD(P)-dependent dehydrogenase (short-subunit alcohol dehydrogenase family)